MFKGSIAALITPFKGGKIDETNLRRLVDWHVKHGTNGVVPTGTTGESPTLTHEEHMRVVEITVEQAAGRIPVIAGAGSNSTREAAQLTKHAADVGADGALLIAPYYNKPGQRGIFAHFAEVSKKADIPIVLYNHAGRTGVTIEPETVAALAKVGNFVAVKDASGGINYTAEVLQRTNGAVSILSGNDTWTPALMALGATGCISVVANIVPKKHAQMISLIASGEMKKGIKLYYELLPLMKAMDMDTNPIPVKEAMGMMGMAEPEPRLPLLRMDAKKRAALRAVLKSNGLVK
jgi:4-hydroxy-tetrahydrodipicolinate synthase